MIFSIMLAAVLVQPLAGLEKSDRWTTERPEACPLLESEGRLEIGVKGSSKDGPVRVLLKQPLAVPKGADLYFRLQRPRCHSVFLKVLVRDEAGQEFAVWTGGTYHLAKSNAFGGQFRPDIVLMSGGEWRAKAGLSSFTRENATCRKGAVLPAKGRLTWLGLELEVESGTPSPDQKVWLRDFKFSDVSYANSTFYYTFAGQERFGEIDGDPVFSGLDVQADTWGPMHVLDWELRDTYDAKPFLQGSRECGGRGATALPGTAVGLAPRASRFVIPQDTFHVRERGSYWLHLRWATRWEDFGKPTAHPGRVWNWTIRYDVFRGEPPKAHAPVADAELNTAARERLLAQATFRAEAVDGPRPYAQPPLPSGEEIRTGKKSLVLFNPMIHNKAESVKHYAAMMDQLAAEGLKREIEISVSWPEIERLPGVRDFRQVDAILDAAKERGFGCYVTFGTLVPPEWMPSWFTQNEDGRIFGHTIYTFNGGRFNVCHHPQGRQAALDFAAALCDHVKGHPALIGYFYLVEHGGDAPWVGWYEGYDEFTRANFRSKYGVEPPHQKKPRPEDTPARLRDWTDFKAYSLEKLQWDVVKIFRERDPYRSIMVYGSPTLGMGCFDYSKIGGVITANGGCDTPATGYRMTAVAEAGIPQRAEEISCANWKARGATQLDKSLFNMMQGGGLMTHFKMFLPQNLNLKSGDWREKSGFDRFLKFIPIEAELRGAERVDARVAGWTSSKGADFPVWHYEAMLNSQLQLSTSVTPKWKTAKAVFVARGERMLRSREILELKQYVEQGGTLVVNFNSGMRTYEKPEEKYVLLRTFGISEPFEPWHASWYFTANVTSDSPWWPRANGSPSAYAVKLRGPVKAPADAGEVLMRMTESRYAGAPALTRKRYGQGRVCVIWCDEIIPYRREQCKLGASKPFLAEIAADAGAPVLVHSSRREVYANLLRKGDTYYLLAMSEFDMPEPAVVSINTRLSTLNPQLSTCTAVDLISGERQTLPLSLKLERNQVQIWKLGPMEVVK